jgi:hypothetical protein
MSAAKKKVNLLRTAVLVVLFIACCGGLMLLLTPKSEEKAVRTPVKQNVPPSFPVLFFSSKDDSKPRVIRYEHFDAETKQHPEYSLLVPEGKESEVNAWLRDSKDGNYWKDVIIEASSEGKQSLKLRVDPTDEFSTTAWYNATEKEIFPRYFDAHRGPAGLKTLLKYGALAFVITSGVFLLGFGLWRKRFAAAQ